MKYFVLVGNKIRIFDSILKEENGLVYFTPRLKRRDIRDFDFDGFMKMSDEDWNKLRDMMKLIDKYGFYVRTLWGTYRDKIRIAVAKMFVEQFEISESSVDLIWGGYRNRILWGTHIDNFINHTITPIDDISVKFDDIIYYSPIGLQKMYDELDDTIIEKYNVYTMRDELWLNNNTYFDKNGSIYNGDKNNRKIFLRLSDSLLYNKRNKAIDKFCIPDKICGLLTEIGFDISSMEITREYKEYNFIEIQGKNITYIPANRVEKYLETNNREKYAQTTSIMKFLKSVFNLKDSTITKISEILDFDNNDFSKIQIISGEKISWAYNHGDSNGTIGRSCMKDATREMLKIYEDNAEMVCIIENDIVKARAILWELTHIRTGQKIKFMDRIYVADTKMVGLFKNYASTNGWLYLATQTFNQSFSATGEDLTDYYVQLNSKSAFEKFPYVDTWCNKVYDRLYCEGLIQRLR